MTTSNTSICNIALGLIGAGRISDINGATSVERDCKSVFDAARDETLEGYHWSFAREQVELAMLSSGPLHTYAYSFQLPADCISPIMINGLDDFRVLGNEIYCNHEEDVFLEYTKRVENAALFTAKFVNVLAHRLAAPLAMMVKKDQDLSLKMWDLYKAMLDMGETSDSHPGGDGTKQSNPYVEARG